jgi:hypothetical protein
MSRILASVALAAVVFAVPALASDVKSEFGNVKPSSQTLFTPSSAKTLLTTPTEQKTLTYSGGDLFSSSITDAHATQTLDLNLKAPDAGSSFAAGEAAKAVLVKAK